MMIDGVLGLTLVALVQWIEWPTYTFGPPLRDTARTDILGLIASVELYQVHERGACPGSVDDLRRAGVIKKANTDPWGNEYAIFCRPGFLAVLSAGGDGRFGTEDDMSSHEGE